MDSRDHELVSELTALVRADAWIMGLLQTVRTLDLESWCIAAGTIRNSVWDHLHGHRERTPPTDIDVLFFDPAQIDPSREAELERRLAAARPDVRWEVVNQATIHTYTGDKPYDSIQQAMSRWADPVTAVGIHLTRADQVVVTAPFGLRDLFGLVVRPNLVTPNAAAVYRERMAAKRWLERWPRLIILPLEE